MKSNLNNDKLALSEKFYIRLNVFSDSTKAKEDRP